MISSMVQLQVHDKLTFISTPQPETKQISSEQASVHMTMHENCSQ